MKNFFHAILQFANHDPVIATGMLVLSVLIVPLGGLHLFRIFCAFAVVLVGEFKHELYGVGQVLDRLWRELTRWKLGP